MNAVDTNVLIYVHDPRDPKKQRQAADVVREMVEGVLLWQVATEYLRNADKLAGLGFNRARAFESLRKLRQVWKFSSPTPAVIERGEMLLQQRSLSFWDALIVAACLDAGVARLYSEDINPGGNVELTFQGRKETLELVNPFAAP